MPRIVPSQIGQYLTSAFAPLTNQHSFSVPVLLQKAGAIAGFLTLYDHLPRELLVLPPDDYASLVAGVGTIRLAVEQLKTDPATGDCLKPVGSALPIVWRIIETLPDAVPSAQHDLSFIADIDLRQMIGLDLFAISTALQSGEWKGATIISGSCSEALLLYGLLATETKKNGAVAAAIGAIAWSSGSKPHASKMTDQSWNLFAYAEVARQLGLISDNTKSAIDAARNYRNLIHPAKSIRQNAVCNRGTAYVSVGAVEHVINDLRKNL